MFFSLHIGTDEGAGRWRTVMADHARWLGLVLHLERRVTRSPRSVKVSAGWLLPKGGLAQGLFLDAPSRFLATSCDGAFLEYPLDGSISTVLLRGEVRALRIVACLLTGEVSVAVPPATPEQCIVRRAGAETLLTNDFRIAIRSGGLELDARALWALYEYGAVPAPFTLDRKTHRVPDGHWCKLNQAENPVVSAMAAPSIDPKPHDETPNETAAMGTIDRALDTQLAGTPPGAVLYFSGGVDSGLLASRLARLGRRDVLLLNYLLGDEDGHSLAARRIAKRLEMPFEQIGGNLSRAHLTLERAALDYSAPFSDPALVTTNHLVHASLAKAPQMATVIDGTGADGGFGFGEAATRAWRRARSVPAPLQHLGSTAYHVLGAWRFESRLEKGLRELRSLSKAPVQHAAVALGPLDGIAYSISSDARRSVEEAIASIFGTYTDERSLRDQLAYLDLVQTGAARFAAKVFDPLRRHGVRSVYPYLDPALIRAAFRVPWSIKCRGGKLKSLLKRMLLRDLPAELVDLPKQGFAAPVLDVLAEPEVREFMSDVVLVPENPAMSICSERTVRAMASRAGEGGRVSTPAKRFLWSLLFTSAWIHGVRSELNS